MIEQKILIGLITSTDYCQAIRSIWDPRLIESVTAKRLAIWVWEYFEKYNRAPGQEIESIYMSKLKESNLPKDLIQDFEEEILPQLVKSYNQEGFNLQYLLEETNKYFSSQHISLTIRNVQSLLLNGKVTEAEEMIRSFRPLKDVTSDLTPYIFTSQQIRKRNRQKPITLMKPWLKEGQTTIIYGTAGSGKSLLALLIAYVLGVKCWEDSKCEIGEWQVKTPTGCLYVDGELGEQEMDERIRQFEWIGPQINRFRLQVFPLPEYQLETEDPFFLSDRANQKKIIRWLQEHPSYKLIVLDSVSTLFGLAEENDNSEWNTKINPFLRDLRALNVACLLLHHSGKDNKRGLRGASAMSAMAHNIFRLKDHTNKQMDDGEAWFVLEKDKQRSAGMKFRKFALHFTQENDGKETHWEITSTND